MGKIGDVQEEDFWKRLKDTLHIEQELSYSEVCKIYAVDYSRIIRLVQTKELARRKINGVCYVNRRDIEKLLESKVLLHTNKK